uniref:Galactokinase N-terminal domain-containing protein n=1 Tax=Rhinopithecus bieti TaxID=61621 RepID=A0A2K6K4X2_RHIBE
MAAESPAMRRVQVAEHPRLLKLKEMFNSKFGSIPKFYVRAPGRVNVIGEHIDYCGYSVLPMAIEQDVLIAVEPVKTYTLQLANTNPLLRCLGQGSLRIILTEIYSFEDLKMNVKTHCLILHYT